MYRPSPRRAMATTFEALMKAGVKTLDIVVDERMCSACGERFEASFITQNVCPACVERDIRLSVEEARDNFTAERQRRLARIGLEGILTSQTFEAFRADEQPAAYDAARRFVEDWPDARGLVLLGNPGTGKTFLACAILLALADHGIEGHYVNLVEASARLRRVPDWRIEADRLLSPLQASPCVVLDDIGREKSSDALVEQLDAIINHRWVVGAPTVLAGNLTVARLVGTAKEPGWISQATTSRILSIATVLTLDGEDRRLSGIRPRSLASRRMNNPSESCATCQGAGWMCDSAERVGRVDRLRKCSDCDGRGW